MKAESIKTITADHMPEKFSLHFTVETIGKREVVKDLGISARRTFSEPKVLINGKPYWCGCGRVFTKKSFDKIFSKFRKTIAK